MTKRSTQPYAFTVEGGGEFPFDMLRYDRCWPHYSQDAAAMSPHESGRRRIVLESCSASLPESKRWQSFGWRVIAIGVERESLAGTPA